MTKKFSVPIVRVFVFVFVKVQLLYSAVQYNSGREYSCIIVYCILTFLFTRVHVQKYKLGKYTYSVL